MTKRFTERLRERVAPTWEAQHNHPFVRGIGDGSLDLERFKHWVRQDYLFLIEYGRLLAFTAARAPDLETMTRFAELLLATVKTEMDLHRAYARLFGIPPEELEREPMSPTTRGYTDFLVRTAAAGSFPEAVAALLPCLWGFCEIGQRLAERGLPADERYAEWIRMYSSEEYVALAEWGRGLLDRLAEGLPEGGLGRLEEIFLTSSRYEYLFWEMAYRLERWPV